MPLAAIPLPPPLREGDRLTAMEFLRRWDAMPDLEYAELIDGIVFMASPVSKSDGRPHINFSGWIWMYCDSTPGCEAMAETTSILGDKDVPQPDITLRILPELGGQSHDEGDYVSGAPELIVEVSGSSSSRDLGIKLDLYRRTGVREYLTVLLKPRQVIWRRLVRGRYEEMEPGEDGLLRSHIFPGLWLDPAAVWDAERSLRPALELGLQSPEHAAFVRKLTAKR
jgi:Uma2 family endonuclease